MTKQFTGKRILIVGIVAVVVSLVIFNTQAISNTVINLTLRTNPDLEDGLVGHWTFDGVDLVSNVADRSGQGNNGFLQNDIATTTVDGVLGQAMNFVGGGSGNENYVDILDDDSLTCANAITMAAWVRTDVYSTPGDNAIIVKKRHEASDSYQLQIISSGVVRSYIDTGPGQNLDSTTDVVDGDWHHIIGWWDGGEMRVYVDGVEESSVAEGGTMGNTTHNVGIAWRNSAAHSDFDPFIGDLDDVRIYCRALSGSEIKRLYDLGATTKINTTITTNPDLESGLVGHWTFDGPDMLTNVSDVSGNGNNGALQGHTSTTTVVGVLGQALDFDGSDDYVNLGNPSSLSPANGLTVALWQKVDDLSGSRTWVTKDTDACCDQEYMFRTQDNGQIRFWVNGNGKATIAGDITIGVWQHVVGTWDGSNMRIYLDGVDQGSPKAETGPISDNGADVMIGRRNESGGGLYFDGSMDDVRIYNRALSASEVSRLYGLGATTHQNVTLAIPGLTDGLVAHWTFDGPDMVSNVADRTGNGNNGTIGGQTSTTTAIGKIGQALSFDGSDDYLDLGTSRSYDSNLQGSIATWVKFDDAAAGTQEIYYYDDGAATGFGITLEGSGSFANFKYYMDDGGVGSDVSTGASYLVAGEWYHIVVTSDSSTIKLYINGSAQGLTGGNEGDWIGDGGDATHRIGTNLGGVLDDYRIYNRPLSLNEVQRLYGLGSPTKMSGNNLPAPSDLGRSPTNGSNRGGGTGTQKLYMNAWLDPEGDDVEYYFEYFTNTTVCSGSPTGNSGWITDPTTAGGYTVSVTDGQDTAWRVKGRDTSNDETDWNSCYDFDNTAGSCPFLYVWDGEKFNFETDINATGKLALKTSRGYIKPNPNDYYVLEANPAEVAGTLDLRFVGQRLETNYWDLVKLFYMDVPEDVDVYADIPNFGVPFNNLADFVHTIGDLRSPTKAIYIDTGEDVTDKLFESDKDYLILNEDRNDFDYQTIEVDFGDLSGAEQIKLVLDGNSFFPDSKEGIALSRTLGPRTKLEVLDENNQWVEVLRDVFELPRPPEFKRVFVMDVSDIFVSDNYKVRLTYLLKTYIDSIKVDTTLDESISLTETPLESAMLGFHGVSNKTTGEIYEYVYDDIGDITIEPFPGMYTKYGDVTELLSGVDDKFVLYHIGDEIKLKFRAPNEPKAGMKRKYIMHSYSFYKNAKIDVSHTVEPMPFTAMSNFPYDESVEHYPDDIEHQNYLMEWNTRSHDSIIEKTEAQGDASLEELKKLFMDLVY